MEVHELTFTLPLSRMSVSVSVSETLEFESHGDHEGNVSIDFDPQTIGAIHFEETRGTLV